MWELIADTEKGKFTDDKEVKKLRNQVLNESSLS